MCVCVNVKKNHILSINMVSKTQKFTKKKDKPGEYMLLMHNCFGDNDEESLQRKNEMGEM